MPGWHARTEALVADGRLAVAGIVEEQHGDRAALFMEWQQMGWPVMVDALNLLGVRAVPITFLIDGAGIIRAVNPDGDQLETFLGTDYPDTAIEAPAFIPQDEATRLAVAAQLDGDRGAAIEALADHVAAHPDDAPAWFRLGVLLRARHDSAGREPGDFAAAVAAWGEALARDPGQYIWRRRIQQYGPRLDKPYPFYDWVAAARAEMAARGQSPPPLVAKLTGAEIAHPESDPVVAGSPPEHPDPDGRLPVDGASLVAVRPTVVPSTDAATEAYRIHLEFEPSAEGDVHWNNEAGQSQVWLEVPAGWTARAQMQPLPDPDKAAEPVSGGTRRAEFEVRRDSGAGEGGPRTHPLRFSAFYYVCEGASGTCQFLKNSFVVDVPGS